MRYQETGSQTPNLLQTSTDKQDEKDDKLSGRWAGGLSQGLPNPSLCLRSRILASDAFRAWAWTIWYQRPIKAETSAAVSKVQSDQDRVLALVKLPWHGPRNSVVKKSSVPVGRSN